MEIQDKTRLKKRFSNQVASKFSKVCDDRVSNPKSQKVRGTSSPRKKPTYKKCSKKRMGKFLVGTDNCFGCGKSGQKVRDFPNVKGQDNGSGQTSVSNVDAPRKNRFYSIRSTGEEVTSFDVVIDMLQFFSLNVYTLLDLGATLSFVTPLIDRIFDILPDILNETFMVTTPVGDSMVAKRVYINCTILLPNRVTHF